MKTLLVIVVLLAIVFLSGCSHYVAPGAGLAPASLAGPGGSVVQASPTARFPARVAVVRVQAPNYRNHNTDGYGSGAFSVVTTREIESDDDFARLSKLPQLAGIAMLNRLVLPPHFTGDRELRQAAAKLQADVLLIYSFDTTFRIRDHDIGPLGVITLGMLPNHEARVISTCSAALFDVNTGFIYGLAEGTGRQSELASVWRTRTAIDSARQKAEEKAFAALVPELEQVWTGIVSQHASARR